jgi:hypothetical protein
VRFRTLALNWVVRVKDCLHAGIQKYLGSGLIKGIGPVMAERMVAHFGVDISTSSTTSRPG